MPLVRISLLRWKSAEYRRKVGDAVHQALVETIGVPAKHRFQIITRHDPEDFFYDTDYLGIQRSGNIVIIQITLSAERLGEEVGLRPEDAWVNLVEVAKENWSFGNGIASYAPETSAEQPVAA